jgi:hypothetical protein
VAARSACSVIQFPLAGSCTWSTPRTRRDSTGFPPNPSIWAAAWMSAFRWRVKWISLYFPEANFRFPPHGAAPTRDTFGGRPLPAAVRPGSWRQQTPRLTTLYSNRCQRFQGAHWQRAGTAPPLHRGQRGSLGYFGDIACEPAESELCLAAHEEALDELDHPFG